MIESVIINKSIKSEQILICDRNALLYAIRRLAYGDEYNASMTCTRCGKENELNLDLSTIDNREFDFDKYPKGQNSFDFLLPTSKIQVTFKLPNKIDEDVIARELETFSKISNGGHSKEITTRLTQILTSVDGNTDKMRIRKFVGEELLSKDSLALRIFMRNNMPDIVSKFNFSCKYCDFERSEDMPMGISFFWPDR